MSLDSLELVHLAALAAALGWASGMRLYAVVFLTGAAGALGWVTLPPGLQVLQHPAVLAVSFAGMAAEFVADKIPGFDSLWDALHTFVRIPAGAALAAGVFGGDSATWAVVAALLGGTLAATAHAAKASTRAAVNTSPEPFSNWTLSLAGDAFVPALLVLAFAAPAWALALLAVLLVLALWLIVRLFGVLRRLLRRLAGGGWQQPRALHRAPGGAPASDTR